MASGRVNFVTLGCSKNLVDTERLMKLFADAGFRVVHEVTPRRGDIMIVNTCGFIGDAKEESINTILEYLQLKKSKRVKCVYVMGCLSQRYLEELRNELPEVDGWYGKFDFTEIIKDISKSPVIDTGYDRIITTPSHYTYLKIAEGCNRFCAFCAIPLITGRFKSRPEDEIIAEVKTLVGRGVKEFNIVAQDLSSYGLDLYGDMRLPALVEKLAQITGVEWLRLHYAYPAQFPDMILDVMARYPNVCSYLDIALQHISDPVLENMRRHITGAETRRLIAKMRRKVPGLHLRTTLMVGFPGEGEKEFEELLEFVRETRFERMGAFAYCEEEDTFAANNFADSIPEDIKKQRLERLMALQESISLELQQQKVGKVLRVIIDKEDSEYFVGRTEWDSPEVDPEVLIKKTRKLIPGNFYNVKIIEALPFELIGEVEDE